MPGKKQKIENKYHKVLNFGDFFFFLISGEPESNRDDRG